MLKIHNISFQGKPDNYTKIDNFLSRSAQPQKDDFKWLREQGVTDVINFRTMKKPGLDFSEEDVVESLGMKYHNIPTVSAKPEEKGIFAFLSLLKNIKQKNGKAHIHCKAGADRTGMYSFVYKSLKGIGTQKENVAEWIQRGHNTKRYPNMIVWTENFLKKIAKK